MKFFVALFALAAVASALPARRPDGVFDANIQAIIDAINHPSTDPGTAALLWDQLESIMNPIKPEDSPISVGPVIIDEGIIPTPVQVAEPNPAPVSSGPPVVQVIINVNPNVPGNLVSVEQPKPVTKPEIVPTPVIVVENSEPEIVPTPVIVVENPEPVPEPVLIAPIITPPVSISPIQVQPIPH